MSRTIPPIVAAQRLYNPEYTIQADGKSIKSPYFEVKQLRNSMARFPALFVGHGSPLLALSNTDPSVINWKRIAEALPNPKAILAISAHWYVGESCVTAQEHPRTIHDFGGFPQELYDVEYPAPGSPELAERVATLVAEVNNGRRPRLDKDSWGLDHGTWSVLRHMYPDANIPVIQLSIDARKPDAYHYELGRQLSKLRDEGILILGTGNLVHNFAYVGDFPVPPSWAVEFVDWFKQVSQDSSVDREKSSEHPLVHWKEHKYGKMVQNGPDHFLPSLYVLGTADQNEEITWTGDQKWDWGSISMACFQVGAV